jgi:hypothetical protein
VTKIVIITASEETVRKTVADGARLQLESAIRSGRQHATSPIGKTILAELENDYRNLGLNPDDIK